MKKYVLLAVIVLLVSACQRQFVETIKADDFYIAYGDQIYTEHDADQETIQALVDAYHDLQIIGETSEDIDLSTAVAVTFIYEDKISAVVTIDDKGLVETTDTMSTQHAHPDNTFYAHAIKVFEDIQEEFN